MSIKLRSDLKSNYFPGAKPTAASFHDMIDSAFSLAEVENLPLKGAVTIADFKVTPTVPTPPDGTIAKVGNELQVFFGNVGKPVGGGGLPVANIPIGGTNTASGISIDSNLPGRGINLGAINTAISPAAFQGAAILANKNQFTIDTAALMQEQSGNTWLNAPDAAAGGVRIALGRKPVISVKKNKVEFSIDDTLPATAPEFVFLIGAKRALSIRKLTTSSVRTPTTNFPGGDGILQIYGEMHQVNGANQWVTSDARLKKEVEPFADGLAKLKRINPVRFKYNGMGETHDGHPGIGVIAQEIKPLLPYSVKEFPVKMNAGDQHDTDVLLFDSHALTYMLINAVKELSARLEQLEKQTC